MLQYTICAPVQKFALENQVRDKEEVVSSWKSMTMEEKDQVPVRGSRSLFCLISCARFLFFVVTILELVTQSQLVGCMSLFRQKQLADATVKVNRALIVAYVYVYVYVYLCTCMCVHMCEWTSVCIYLVVYVCKCI